MKYRVEIESQSPDGVEAFTVQRVSHTIGGSAQADALCQAANSALIRAVPDSQYRLYVAKRVEAEVSGG